MNILRQTVFSSVGFITKSIIRPVSNSSNLMSNMDITTVRGGAKRIVWVDLEMTGLDIEKDHILEIACLVTDAQLNIVAKGPNLIIHQPDDILSSMNPWCVNQHGESGLMEASRKSKISLRDAENQVLKFVTSHVPEKKCPLGGNSVYMDRLFLRKYMPRFDNYLHYRIIDVSTIKELAKRWYSREFSRIPQKKFKHRSIDDILESIEELKYYRENIFKNVDADIEN
ncbi:probable oligoribonuclease [Pectinophora gossypiella]|uniref:probable oligoribonuclease n=1 Tax=Pectinophora gossypiella TaxID=13191 RepID=UPI00214E71D5|nr:probable oligoribonuclease [Pectinophora gossypiella]